jgi:hypothetical protein
LNGDSGNSLATMAREFRPCNVSRTILERGPVAERKAVSLRFRLLLLWGCRILCEQAICPVVRRHGCTRTRLDGHGSKSKGPGGRRNRPPPKMHLARMTKLRTLLLRRLLDRLSLWFEHGEFKYCDGSSNRCKTRN